MQCCCQAPVTSSDRDLLELLDPWSLYFKHASTEKAFCNHRGTRLRYRLRNACLLMFPMHCFPLLLQMSADAHLFEDTEVGSRAQFLWGTRRCVLILVTLICGCLTFSSRTSIAEPVAVIGTSIEGVVMTFGAEDLCALLADDLDECLYRRGPNRLLWASAVIAAGTTFLPMRSSRCTIVLVTTVLGATTFCCISMDDIRAVELSVFIILAGLCFCAGRMGELHERMSFARIAQETALRAETERELEEHVAALAESNRELVKKDDAVSVAETVCTAKVFKEGVRLQGLGALQELGMKEQWLIDPGKLLLKQGRVLGWGYSGIVAEGSYCRMRVAVKLPRKPSNPDDQKVAHMMNELRVLRKVRHPNIVMLHGACFVPTTKDVLLVTEFIAGHSLREFVDGSWLACPTDGHRLGALEGLCHALMYLHTRAPAIIHGDLKPANIRVIGEVGHELRVQTKLLDFGLSRIITPSAEPCGGTRRWAAPELIRKEKTLPTSPMDIFSFGRVMFFVITGRQPYAFLDEMELTQLVKRSRLRVPLDWQGLCAPSRQLVQNLQPLADSCMHEDDLARPSIENVDMLLLRRCVGSVVLEDTQVVGYQPCRSSSWPWGAAVPEPFRCLR